ncbi:MAG: ATP-binding protein [Terriglobia bacterium]|jgi:two-component system, NtrC family, nitrogen regulation sensor histidine kinase NtrY
MPNDSAAITAHPPRRSPRRRMRFEIRMLLFALFAGFPAVLATVVLLWVGDYASATRWTVAFLVVVCWLGAAFSLHSHLVYPLQTLSNLLAALREEDYSLRARGARPDDALGEVMVEVNALGDMLRGRRLGALEATALLRKVMEEIDVAVFTFDSEQRLRLMNRAGERLLGQPTERIMGQTAAELSLRDCLEGDPARTLTISFPGGTGRWAMRRSAFRENGMPHELLVLTDLSRPLREEERQAWQRLIRVLGHELNNSLAPIKSMAGTLEAILARQPRAADWEDDMRRGLGVIGSRAAALSRFLEAYSRLAKLPRPKLEAVEAGALVRRVVRLENRTAIALAAGPALTVRADADQLEQLLINLLRNAVDAALETGGGVSVGWTRRADQLEVCIQDEGPGLLNTSNLFVPFFTTKPTGSGIGLVLSRQIAEAHGGSLTLENRKDRAGCEARLRLPLQESHSFAEPSVRDAGGA